MTGYVLDASVAAKWFLPEVDEPLTAEASAALGEYVRGSVAFVVPDLFWAELGNILWKSVRVRRIARRSAEEAVSIALNYRIPTIASAELLDDAFSLAVSFDRTVYDSLYVALAVRTGHPFLTADERLASALAAYVPVRWLGAWY